MRPADGSSSRTWSPPEDMLPGVPYWYASTCRECSAGCGILVKAARGPRDQDRGQPRAPGEPRRRCARAVTRALQGLYDPDRDAQRRCCSDGAAWKAVTWDEASKLAADKLGQAKSGGKSVALVTEHATGSFERARQVVGAGGGRARTWCSRRSSSQSMRGGQPPHVRDGRGAATSTSPGAASSLSFGADFLETWGTPVAARARLRRDARARDGESLRRRRAAALADRRQRRRVDRDRVPAARWRWRSAWCSVILIEGLRRRRRRRAQRRGRGLHARDVVEQQTDVPADDRAASGARVRARRARAWRSRAASPARASSRWRRWPPSTCSNYVAGNVGQTVRFDRALNFDAVALVRRRAAARSRRMADGGLGRPDRARRKPGVRGAGLGGLRGARWTR